MTDERIISQLAAKHPERKEELPESLDGYAAFQRLELDLTDTLRQLDPKAGTGVSGCRNGYLKALS